MTESQMLKAIYDDMQLLKTDVSELKTDVSELKTDVSELKTDVSGLKADVNGLNSEVGGLKDAMQELQDRVQVLEGNVKGLQLTLENETNRNIRIIAEGHLDLNRKLDEALKVENEKELMYLRVNVLENDMRRVKEKVGIA